MTYSLHPGAEQDIANALDFYTEHAGPLVARRFLNEFERVAMLLVEHPDFGTPIARGRRVFPLRVFPYRIRYIERKLLLDFVLAHKRAPACNRK